MAVWKKTLIAVAIFAVAILGFMSWYAVHYSMDRATQFEVNSYTADTKVLIATQGSAFKDAVVEGIVAHLKPRRIYIRVIDVATLPTMREADWDAIVVIHTWQMHEPQRDAKNFIDRVHDVRKLVVLSTSGAGTFKMDGVDAISAASVMSDVPQRVSQVNSRLDAILHTTAP